MLTFINRMITIIFVLNHRDTRLSHSIKLETRSTMEVLGIHGYYYDEERLRICPCCSWIVYSFAEEIDNA